MTDDDPPPKKPRAAKKPPRASWEPPDTDEEEPATERAPTVSTSGTSEPTSATAPTSTLASSAPGTSSYAPSGMPTSEPSGAHAAQAYTAPTADTSGAHAAPTSEAPASGHASGAYAQPGYVASDMSGYTQPSGAYPAQTSGAYEASNEPSPASDPSAYSSGTSLVPASGATSLGPPPSDDPLAPLSTADDALRAAAGVKPRKRRAPTEPVEDGGDDGGDRPRSSKLFVVSMFALVIGLGIASLVLLGNFNKDKYAIHCEPDQIVAAQGRGFPPWGTRPLDDSAMWKPIKIPPEAECLESEPDDIDELSGIFLARLEERANVLLQTRDVTKTDEAATLLEQALLHTRSPGRQDKRAQILRLLGDVQYWHASAKLLDASKALTEAAKQFDSAAAQRPRHVSDASAWALHVRKLVEDLRAGPAGAPQTSFPPLPPNPVRPQAPPGVALPVDDAGAGSAEEPPAVPDAGIPTGGVLL